MYISNLSNVYRDYIACLNRQDWPSLGDFVDKEVQYNGKLVGLPRYQAMLEGNFTEIPDLYFNVVQLIADSSTVASRLRFDCTPTGRFLGVNIDGRRVSFAENVFYEFRGGKIWQVWSVIDKVAIETQLGI